MPRERRAAGGGGAGQSCGSTKNAGVDGTANTGGGGGAVGAGTTTFVGGNGGSGVVVIRALTSSGFACTGGTKTTVGAYDYYTFTASGTLTVTNNGNSAVTQGTMMPMFG